MNSPSESEVGSFSERNTFLCEPTYKYTRDGKTPYFPTVREVLVDLLDTIDFVRRPRRVLNAALFVAHWSSGVCLYLFVMNYLSAGTFTFWLVAVVFLCNGPHTLWYHRYCSHRAFRFKSPGYAKPFLWANPLYTPEEHYAIAHRQHHAYAENVGDPYGPHIGWLGSYFAIDSIQKLNVDISPARYEQLKKSVEHIGFELSSYAQFQKTGLVERLRHYVARTIVAQTLWSAIAYSFGGVPYVVTWYAATFMLWVLLRDFGWRGHRGVSKRPGWEFHHKSCATNQRFYGYLASEWHDNHHHFPNSANLAFLPGQFDITFQMIRLMKALGMLRDYQDKAARFAERKSTAAGLAEGRGPTGRVIAELLLPPEAARKDSGHEIPMQ